MTAAKRKMDWAAAVSQPIEDGKLRMGPDGGAMDAACHHQKRGACGGCYARLITLLYALDHGAAGPKGKALGDACGEAIRREAKP